jgi:hypothetical protein
VAVTVARIPSKNLPKFRQTSPFFDLIFQNNGFFRARVMVSNLHPGLFAEQY